MGWEDTVLTPEQLNDAWNSLIFTAEEERGEKTDLKVQAKASYEAGYQAGLAAALDFIAANRGHLWPWVDALKKKWGIE